MNFNDHNFFHKMATRIHFQLIQAKGKFFLVREDKEISSSPNDLTDYIYDILEVFDNGQRNRPLKYHQICLVVEILAEISLAIKTFRR